MKESVVAAIRQFSPKHYHQIAEAAQAAGADPISLGTAIGAKVRELNLISDFPNPFLGGDGAGDFAVAFNNAYNGEGNEPPPEVAVPDFSKMSKVEIEKLVKDNTGVDLDRRFLKTKMVEEAEKVWVNHFSG